MTKLFMPQRWLPLLALSLALSACSSSPKEAPLAGHPVHAQVMTLQSQEQAGYHTVPGTVVASQQVQLSSRLSGYLRGLTVHTGQAVQSGQMLFQVDPADVDSQVAQAQAGLAQAQANFADAQSNYDRFKKLYAAQAIPEKQWDQVKSQYAMAKAQVAAAQAGAGGAQSQLRYARVTAPFSGVVTEKFLQNGDMVAPGRPVLALANPHDLEVQLSVSGQSFATLHMGQGLTVSANQQRATATVTDLVPVADSMTHSHLVKLRLAASSDFQAGDFVQVEIPGAREQRMLVPNAAVQDRAGIPGVFVVDAQGIAHYRMVRLGATSPAGVEILAGVEPGERVVVSNVAAVDNGDQIVASGDSHG